MTLVNQYMGRNGCGSTVRFKCPLYFVNWMIDKSFCENKIENDIVRQDKSWMNQDDGQDVGRMARIMARMIAKTQGDGQDESHKNICVLYV